MRLFKRPEMKNKGAYKHMKHTHIYMCFRKEKRDRIIDASKIVDPNNKWECGKAPMG